MLTPTKMEMCKITAYKQKRRAIIRALHKFGQMQIYDMEKQVRTQPMEIEERKRITEYISRIEQLLSDLRSESTRIKPIIIDEEDLSTFLAECDNFLSKVEPEVASIQSEIKESTQKLADLENQREAARGLVKLDFDVNLLGAGKDFFCTAGQIPGDRIERFKFNLRGVAHDKSLLLVSSSPRTTMSFIVVGVPTQFKEALEHVLGALGFIEFQPSEDIQGKKPQDILTEVEQWIKEAKTKITELETKYATIVKEHVSTLLAYKEQLNIELERFAIRESLWEDESTIEMWGWVPATKKRATTKIIEKVDPEAHVEFLKPPLAKEEYPTQLGNPKFIKSYEPLVHSFGTPGYGKDWDPTIFMFFTIPLIFGIMFADVGHGFLLTLMGILGMMLKEVIDSEGMVDMLKEYLQKGGPILLSCGLSSIFFGFLFGSIFGLHGAENPFLINIYSDGHSKASGAAYYVWSLGFLQIPTWFVPAVGEVAPLQGNATGIFLLLELSLLIGAAQISSGFILQAIHEIRHKKLVEAILGPISFLVMYVSAMLLLFTYGANIMEWFGSTPKRFTIALLTFTWDPHAVPIIIPGGIFVFLPGILIPLVLAAGFHLSKGMDGVSHLIDTVISLIGNTVSYARIFAINIVHGIISLLPFLVLGTLGLNIIPIVGEGGIFPLHGTHAHEQFGLIGFILGALIVMTLELMITFLQCLRLHWVEWFGKLHYRGGGFKFNPFKEIRRFSIVKAGTP